MKCIRLLVFFLLLSLPVLTNGEFVITPEMQKAALDDIRSEAYSLPLQAGLCDIIGIGRVTNAWDTGIAVVVDNYWVGDPGSNSLSIAVNYGAPPVTNTPIVFFATKHRIVGRLEPTMLWYQFVFDAEWLRSHSQSDELRLFGNLYSWFTATPDNASLVNFASNLVYSTQISTNTNAFYELIRDGFSLNPPDSRISRDSKYAFQNIEYTVSTNLLLQIWADPALTNTILRGIMHNKIYESFGEFPQ